MLSFPDSDIEEWFWLATYEVDICVILISVIVILTVILQIIKTIIIIIVVTDISCTQVRDIVKHQQPCNQRGMLGRDNGQFSTGLGHVAMYAGASVWHTAYRMISSVLSTYRTYIGHGRAYALIWIFWQSVHRYKADPYDGLIEVSRH